MKKIIAILCAVLMVCTSIVPSFATVAQSSSEGGFSVGGMKTEYLENPIGIDVAEPRFSWSMTSDRRGAAQSAYRLTVSSSADKLASGDYDMWDSGRVEDGRSVAIVYGGRPLQPRTRYYWQVTVTDEMGTEVKSDAAYFETGLMSEGFGDAQWIIPPSSIGVQGFKDTVFTLEMDVKLESAGLGIFFGAQDASNRYGFRLVPDDAKYPVHSGALGLRPEKRVNGTHSWEKPGAWNGVNVESLTGLTSAAAKSDYFHIKIEGNNGTTKVYIEDTLVATMSWDSYVLGHFGFFVDKSYNEKAYVDNIVARNASGSVIFSEDFSGTSHKFDGGTQKDGALYISTETYAPNKYVNTEDGFATDAYTLELDMKIQASSAGIVFGGPSKTDHYMWQFLLSSAGSPISTKKFGVRLHKHNGTKYDNIQPGGWNGVEIESLTGITSETATLEFMHVKFEVNGNVITTYVNDTLICTCTRDTMVPLGYFGFRMGQSDKALFDNIVVKDSAGGIIFSEDFSDTEHKFEGGTVQSGALYVNNNQYCVNKYEGDVEITDPDQRPVNSSTGRVNSPAPMLRGEFIAKEKPVSARLYATAAGSYEMYINGKWIEESYFNPGRTNYRHTLQYQTYDVTSLINEGANALGAYIGHGWFQTKWNNFGSTLGLLCKLVLTYSDGTEQTVVTDGSFMAYLDGPVRYEDIMNGESYDASYEVEGWCEPGLDTSNWGAVICTTAAKLGVAATPVYTPTTSVTAGVKLDAVSVTKVAENTFVYDFGQNIAGIPHITFNGKYGQKIKLTYGEVVNGSLDPSQDNGVPGSVYTGNLTDAQATDFYTLKGEQGEIFSPTMTYHGFRYMQLEAVNFDIADVTALNSFATAVKGYVLYNDMDRTGTFDSSDSEVNQLYSNSYWSNIDNFLAIPTDCPQRGERTGWTGDIQVFGRTATYNLDTFAFLEKYLKDMREDQTAAGNIPEVAPAPTWGGADSTGVTAAGWGDVITVLPWTLYIAYGDTRVLSDNFEAMKKWVDLLVSKSTDYVRPDVSKYGDWLEPECSWDNSAGKFILSTPYNVSNTAYAAYSAQIVAKVAAILGDTEAETAYSAHAEGFRSAWVSNFTDGGGKTNCNSQTSYALGLSFGLFDAEDTANAVANLSKAIADRGNRLKTGFLGVSYINPVLSDGGNSDLAYTLLHQDQYPSWLYTVKQGMTTITEKWDGIKTTDGKAKITGSLNHYSYGAISEWLYRYVLGIDTAESGAGYKEIILQPTVGGELTYAKGAFDSMYGTIKSAWKLEDRNLIYDVTVPANTTATLYLPLKVGSRVTESGKSLSEAEGVTLVSMGENAEIKLLSGTYSFTVMADAPLENPITANGFQVRTGDYIGLRSLFTFSDSVRSNNEAQGYTFEEYGVSVCPEEYFYSNFGTEKALVEAGEGGKHKQRVIESKTGEGEYRFIDTATKQFCLAVTRIPKDNFGDSIYFVAYSKWSMNGSNHYTFTVYTTSKGEVKPAISLYDTTLGLMKSGMISSDSFKTETDKNMCLWSVLETGKLVTSSFGNSDAEVGYTLNGDGTFGYWMNEYHAYTGNTATSAYNWNPTAIEAEATTGILWSIIRDGENYLLLYRADPNAAETDTMTLPTHSQGAYRYYAPYNSNYGSASKLPVDSLTVYSPAPSSDVYQKIKTVIVDSGIIGADRYALGNSPYVESLVYSGDLEKMDAAQFNGNTAMKNVICANGLEHMSGFGGINSLVDLTGVESVSLENLFSGCSGIENVIVKVGSTKSSYMEFTFSGTSSLLRYWYDDTAMPDSGVIDFTGATKASTYSKGVFNVGDNIHTVKLPNTSSATISKPSSNSADYRLWNILGQGKTINFVCNDKWKTAIESYVSTVSSMSHKDYPDSNTWCSNITVNGAKIAG